MKRRSLCAPSSHQNTKFQFDHPGLLIVFLLVPGAVAAVSAVWFTIGGVIDLRQLFIDLKKRVSNPLDNGRVEGHVSLADQSEFKNVEEAQQKK